LQRSRRGKRPACSAMNSPPSKRSRQFDTTRSPR